MDIQCIHKVSKRIHESNKCLEVYIMIKIMLACSAGMSTSLLVTKMQEAAKEKGVECEIWAISEVNLQSEIEKCDVLLLGPQVRYILSVF